MVSLIKGCKEIFLLFSWIVDIVHKKVINSPSNNSTTGNNSVSLNGNNSSNLSVIGNGNTTNFHASPNLLSDKEVINNALNDKHNWKRCESSNELFFYNENYLDIRLDVEIVQKDCGAEEYHDFWAKGFPAKSRSVDIFLSYKDKKIGSLFRGVFIDDNRHLVMQPEVWHSKNGNTIILRQEESIILAYYFIEESRELLVNQIIQKTYPSFLNERLEFPIFKSKQLANASFEDDVKKHEREYCYYLVKQGSWEYLRPSCKSKNKIESVCCYN